MGCGKVFYRPEGARRGEILFICNYGLAGNLIGSQMYQIGEPCSACPSGTECSQTYSGLCLGEPDEPLYLRPPQKLPPGKYKNSVFKIELSSCQQNVHILSWHFLRVFG